MAHADKKAEEIIARTERWAENPWEAIKDQAIYTLDSTNLKKPIRPFPQYPYLEDICKMWLDEPFIAIPKSRRMVMTWLMVWLHLWLAMFREGASVFVQSKDALASNVLIQKAEFIYDHIPPGMIIKPQMRGGRALWNLIDFRKLHSFLRGIPQGAHQLRGETATAVFMDEAAFWEKGRESFAATKPTVEGGGRVTVVSSAQNGWFRDLVYDVIR